MKRILLLLALTGCLTFRLQAQETAASRIGLYYAIPFDNASFRFADLDGAPSYSGHRFFAVGATYEHPVSDHWSWTVGLDYARHQIWVTPSFYPGIDRSPQEAEVTIWNIPVLWKGRFGRYFFAEAGPVLNLGGATTRDISSQTGVGLDMGLGVQYDIFYGLSLFANPYIKAHSLISFSSDPYPQRVFESGLRLGIEYAW